MVVKRNDFIHGTWGVPAGTMHAANTPSLKARSKPIQKALVIWKKTLLR